MEWVSLLKQLFLDYTLRTVAGGAAILGIISGMLGTFAVLRKQSLLGDAISHAALPGIALIFLISGSKAPVVLLLGAAVAGWLGTIFVIMIIRNTRIKDDSALGLVLSVFFGFGLMLLTYIQRQPNAAQAGLDKFLFGQAATLMTKDVLTMGIVAVVALLVVVLYWKEFKLLCFDPAFGKSLGYPMQRLEIGITSLLVIAIVIGLQTVGVVLMSAMVVAPAAAARQWTDRLGLLIVLAGVFGAVAGVAGAVLSSTIPKLPTGPVIVLCISGIVFVSVFCAPNRGLLFRWIRERRNRRTLQLRAVLSDLYVLAEQHQTIERGHTIEVLRAMSYGHGGTDSSLKTLEDQGLARQIKPGQWALTQSGYDKARKQQRWEDA